MYPRLFEITWTEYAEFFVIVSVDRVCPIVEISARHIVDRLCRIFVIVSVDRVGTVHANVLPWLQ